jgi:hypothetical protein
MYIYENVTNTIELNTSDKKEALLKIKQATNCSEKQLEKLSVEYFKK